MAHHKSAKKRIRQIERRTEVNRMRVGTIRTAVKKVEEAISDGQKDQAQTAFREAQPLMMSGVSKGIMHRNTVSRRLSRLSIRINAM